MIAVKMLYIVLFPVCVGYSVMSRLAKDDEMPFLFVIALAYGIGAGCITHWMLLLGWLNIPFSAMSINMPLIIFSALLLFSRSEKGSLVVDFGFNLKQVLKDKFSIGLLTFMGLMVYYVLRKTMVYPVTGWDVVATHAFNAKVLYFERSLRYVPNLPHKTYPLHNPLLMSWVSMQLGGWDAQLIKLIQPGYFLGILTVQYYFLRNFVERRFALLGPALLLSSNFFFYHSSSAYRELAILYYNITAVILLLYWMRTDSRFFLILAALCSGFGSFVKLEGTGYLLIHFLLVLFIVIRKHNPLLTKIKNVLFFSVPGFFICGAYHLYKALYIHPRNEDEWNMMFNLSKLEITFGGELLSKLSVVLQRYYYNLFFSGNWNILWITFFISLTLLYKRKSSSEVTVLLTAIFLFFGIYVAGYSLTQHYYWVAETHTVLSRCTLHFFPLAVLSVILINFRKETE